MAALAPASEQDRMHSKSDDIGLIASQVAASKATTEDEKDVERIAGQPEKVPILVDIEHQPVVDDPRLWSPAFKW